MNFKIIPLTEAQIAKLPFPDVARAIGGLFVLEDQPLANHLNVEEFRRLWNEQVSNHTTEFTVPIVGD